MRFLAANTGSLRWDWAITLTVWRMKARTPICWVRGHRANPAFDHWVKGHCCGRCGTYLGWNP